MNASACLASTPRTSFCSSHRTFPLHGGVVRDPVHSQNPAPPSYKPPRSTATFVFPPSASIFLSSLVTSAFGGSSASACLKSTPSTAMSPASDRWTMCISIAFATPSTVFSAGVWKCRELKVYRTPSGATTAASLFWSVAT